MLENRTGTQNPEQIAMETVGSIASEQQALGELLRAAGNLLDRTRRESDTDAVAQPLAGVLQAAERLQRVLRAELAEAGVMFRAPMGEIGEDEEEE